MYRVELKEPVIHICINIAYIRFLMYRVELKVDIAPVRAASPELFLMYRVELKVQTFYL